MASAASWALWWNHRTVQNDSRAVLDLHGQIELALTTKQQLK